MQRKVTFHDMSGTGTKKFSDCKWVIQMKISNGDPVIKMKALNILKVHNYLFRAHKKVSLLTNCCDFKELLQIFEENRFIG